MGREWDFGNIPIGTEKRERRFISLGVQERAFFGINEIEIDGNPRFFGSALPFEVDENDIRD